MKAAVRESTRAGGGPTFRLSWRGYDRREVDRFLARTAADRAHVDDCLTRLDLMDAGNPHGPGAIVAVALREAMEIWAKAEARAERLIHDAEKYAEFARCGSEPAVAPDRATLAPLGRIAQTSRGRFALVLAIVPACGFLLSGLLYRSGGGVPPPATGGDAAAQVRVPAAGPGPTPLAAPTRTVAVPAERTSAVPLVQSEGLVVTLTARRDCWIRTTIDDGTPVERILKPDETILLYAHTQAVLRVGDAAALSILINHQPARALGADGQVVTRRITLSNYETFLAEPPPAPLTRLRVSEAVAAPFE